MKPGDQREEARRTLKRLDDQAEKLLGHSPPEAEAEDRIEIIGKRIGRALSVVLAIVLIVYLWQTYFAG